MKYLLSILAALALTVGANQANAASINNVILNQSDQVIEIENLEVSTAQGIFYYDVEFTDLGLEEVSFNDVFGEGDVLAVQTYLDDPFASQGVFNSTIRSDITRVLQRYLPRNQNGTFQFPPINSDNNRTIMLLLDTSSEAFLAGISTSSSSNTTALRRDTPFADTSFALLTQVPPPMADVPLPASAFLILAGLGALTGLRASKRRATRG